jgi:putative acetyltransferase
MNIYIRDYQPADARTLTDIFYHSVHATAISHYSQAQINAWARLPIDYALWQQRLNDKPPFVAMVDQQAVGFITLEADDHIDWTYVHPDYQRRGIASALYQHLEQQARQRGITKLYVEASELARPLFEKQGFRRVRRNLVCRNDIQLVNWSMEKSIGG